MRDWGRLFKTCSGSGLSPVGTTAGFDKIGQLAVSAGLNYIYIDLAGVADKLAFLKVLAVKLEFPAHFGMNWDALKDSLTDMPPDRGWVIALDNIRGFAEADPKGMLTARNIFKYTARYWSKQAVSFYVLTKM